MSAAVESESSEAIIAALINDVRKIKEKINEPVDVNTLISGHRIKTVKDDSALETSDGSSVDKNNRDGNRSNEPSEESSERSTSHKHRKKIKYRTEKKSKKSKKSKHKAKSKSKSPSRKKKRHHKRRSKTRSKTPRNNAPQVCAIPPSVEAVMENITDDDEELPVGTDFLTMNATTSKSNENAQLLQDIEEAVEIKRREFNTQEEVFPLSKKPRKRPEVSMVLKKPRPLSEILAKVRAERDGALVPRNIKIRNGMVAAESPKNAENTVDKKTDESCVEYGPRLASDIPQTQPISDDDDVLAPPVKTVSSSKAIKIGTISKMLSNSERCDDHSGEDGRVPISDDTDVSHSKHPGYMDRQNLEESERKRKKDKKIRKREKKKKKRHQSENVSCSSDSEKEWKKIEKRRRRKQSDRPLLFDRRADMERRRKAVSLVESYYVGRDQTVYDGSRTFWERSSARRRFRNFSHVREHDSSPERKCSSGSTRSWSRSKSRSRTRASSRSTSPSYSESRSRSSSRGSYSSKYSDDRRSRSSYRYHRRRGRSSSSTSGHRKIDKKKLLEIAQRNAARMAQLGYLPGAAPQTGSVGPSQSVDQLVDFCQKLQRSQDKAERREKGEVVSSDDELMPKRKKTEEETDFIRHPFSVKPTAPITINISNSTRLPIKTPLERALEESQLRICYPVSSGAHHREKSNNEWVPVSKVTKVQNALNSGEEAKNDKAASQDLSPFVLPPPPVPPVLPSIPGPSSSYVTLPPPPPPPVFFHDSGHSTPSNVCSETYNQLVNAESAPVLETPANVGKIMAQKVKASRRLSNDPNDFEAKKMLEAAENQLNAWVESKRALGQFTGSTGANILKAEQLGPDNPRHTAWAKKDLFKQASCVNSGIGMKLMQQMGWTPGEGLGKDCDGPLEPLSLDIKSDRRGLVAADEVIKKRSKSFSSYTSTIAGKHPVSILMELCTKRKWASPEFTCNESGPSNNRKFLWKAVVNGIEYQCTVPSSSKKTAKAQVCEVVLESLGLLPRDPSLPVAI